MKTVIVYASVHHGNTRKIAEAMAQSLSANLIDATKNSDVDLSNYDLIGLASGVYFHSFHEAIKALAQNTVFTNGQRVFLVDTCGLAYRDYSGGLRKTITEKGAQYIGTFQCRGFDTYGIFGKLGGIARKHPSEADLERAREFARRVAQQDEQ